MFVGDILINMFDVEIGGMGGDDVGSLVGDDGQFDVGVLY